MKKSFLNIVAVVAIVSASFVACDKKAPESTEGNTDSVATEQKLDSSTTAPKTDSSTTAPKTDSNATAPKTDSAAKK